MEAPGPPAELQAAPPPVLEAYVHARILHFNSQPALQQKLGPEGAAALQTATQELLGQAGPDGAATSGAEAGAAAAAAAAAAARPPELALVFKHDCLHLGCADLHCKLCEQNQSRKCGRHFAGKYLSGDTIKAACGAPIRVELVDRLTGRLVPQHDPLGLQLCVVDGRAHESLLAAGGGTVAADADLDRITLLLNQQGRPLLAAKSAPSDAQGYVHVPLVGGTAQLPELSVTGSSEALLSGQRPPFALLVSPLQAGEGAGAGERATGIPPLVSEGFVVATPRVRSASKKAVPSLGDHVSKLNCVGSATQAKLKDLRRAASDAGVQGLALPLAVVNTVGEFRQLAVWAQEDPSRLDQVKKMLKLTKGWEEARDHALIAVGADERLRAFFADDSLAAGLLFRCKDANIGLEAPLATLEAATDGSGQRVLVATLLPQGGAGTAAGAADDGSPAPDPARVAAMLTQSRACWARRGHPGWAILPLDTPTFERGCAHLHQVTLPPNLVAAAVPQAAHTAASFLAAAAAAPAALSPGSSGGAGSPTAMADAAPGSPQQSLLGSSPGQPRATSPFAAQQMQHAFATLGVQSPGTPNHPLASPPAAATEAAPASPFQAASPSLPAGAAAAPPAAAGEGGAGDSSLTAKLLRTLGPSMQPPPAQQLQPVAASSPQRSAAVPLHIQLASSGRLALGSAVESASHLPPSPFATGEHRSPECGSPFAPSGEPSLTLPGLPEGVAAMCAAQNAAAGAAAAAAAAAAADMVPVPAGVPANPVHEAPSFDFNAGWAGYCGPTPAGSPPLPAAPPLMLPECPPALGALPVGASPLRRSPTPGLDASLTPAVVAKIISGLPSLNLFAPDGPLGMGAVAELEACTGADGERKVPHIPSLGAMFGTIGSKDLALSNQSVDWEQLLREAYKPPSGRDTPLPAEEGGRSGGRSPPPSPPLLPQQPSPTARAAATAALEAAGGPLGLLRALSHTSVGSLGSLGSLAGPLGTLSAMEWEALLADPNLGVAVEHMPGATTGAPGTEGGAAGAAAPGASGGPPVAPLPALQSRSLGRILTPEWARLLSLSAADWQQLLQEHRQAQAAHQGGAAAATDATPPAEAGGPPAQQHEQAQQAHHTTRPASGLGGGGRGPLPPSGRSRRSALGKRGALTPSHSGLEAMEGVEVEAAP